MGSVIKIIIDEVEVNPAETSGHYDISVDCSTQDSPAPYEGKFTLDLLDYNTGQSVLRESIEIEKKYGQIKGQINDFAADMQMEYQVVVSTKDDPNPKSAYEFVLFHTYTNASASYDGSILKLRWDMPDHRIYTGECIVNTKADARFSYEILPYMSGMDISFSENLIGEDVVFDVIMDPYISECSKGPQVSVSDISAPRYIVESEADGTHRIWYRNSVTDQNTVVIPLDGDIYGPDSSKIPQSPIISENGILSINNEAPYAFTINTGTALTVGEYDAFVKEISDKVTVSALYQILDFIARCACQDLKDMLYFHCGLKPEQRSIDVRPGFSLHIEQEMYMPNIQLREENAAGFIGNHTADYLVSLTKGKDSEYLEFDSLVDSMDESLYPLPNAADTGKKMVSAGIIDLCSVQMRQPYYKIVYPDAMFQSEVEPDVEFTSHVVMSAIPVGAGDVSADLFPYHLFRGRSSLTILITVRINGIERKFPVGITLGKVLRAMGIYTIQNEDIKVYRRTPFGREAKLSFAGGLLEDLPLFHGDRIEG